MQRDPGPAQESQRTLRAPAEVAGVGLFSGAPGRITIRPADAGAGIVFRRVDLSGSPVIPALVDHVVEKPRRTALRAGEATVETVEHLLSALAGLGVDNALIDAEGPEIPAGDGSAAPFVEAIRRAGLVEQGQPRRPLVISRPVVVREGDATVMAVPTEAGVSEMMYVLDYGPGSPLGRQIHTFTVSPAVYAEQIAPARTFSTQAEAEAALQRGLFKHLSPREMLVIGPAGPIENSYRFEDEPVRHKVLDLVGDLSLVGRPIGGRIVAVRSGHALNHRMARELLEAAKHQQEGPAAPVAPVAPAEPATRALAPAMDVRQILRTLPHRYPMVLVDRVLELEPDRRAVGVKNVTINEPFFQGHYPGAPVMPGVLIVEAMCQLAGLMLSRKLDFEGKIAALMALDGVRLRRPVVPGDQLVMETEAVRSSSRYGEAHCRAFVGGELAAEARMKFLMIDPERLRTEGTGE